MSHHGKKKHEIPSVADVVPTLLRSVLQVAHDLRWVADFLFTDLDQSSFHKSLPLPPHAFGTTFSIDVHQHMNVFPPPKSKPSSESGSDAAKAEEEEEEEIPLPVELVGEPDVTKTDDTLLHTIFAPVAAHSFATVGYAFVSHPQTLPNCLPFNPLMPPLIARFVLDERDDTLIFINRGGTPPSLGIRAMRRGVLPNCREHFSFVVPDAPYVWPKLPTNATWMLSHVETDTASYVPPTPSRTSLGQLQVPELDLSVQDASPWPVSDQGVLSDGLTIALNYELDSDIVPIPKDTSTAAAMFTPDVRQAALRALAVIHSGTFHAAGVRMDAFDGLTGKFRSCRTGAVVYTHAATMPIVEDGLRLRLVQAYLSETSCVPNEVSYILPPNQEELTLIQKDNQNIGIGIGNNVNSSHPALDFITALIENTGNCSTDAEVNSIVSEGAFKNTSRATSDSFVVKGPTEGVEGIIAEAPVCWGRAAAIAPRPEQKGTQVLLDDLGVAQSTRRSSGTPKTGTTPAKTRRREEIIADRKHRNRLSAARSNERKRLWVAQLEKDVLLGREKVSQLSSRQDEAVRENRRLRALLGQDQQS